VPALGLWNPAGFPLNRSEENVWTGTVILPESRRIEYKFTRGTWETEEVFESGETPGNYILTPGRIEMIMHRVHHWKDRLTGPTPAITGNYRVHEDIHSRHVCHRKVIVWLPPSYEEQQDQRYPVLYMHDGQQVFDPATSTWGRSWEVDRTATRLIHAKKIQDIIVVAAYSTDQRDKEYVPPQKGEDYTRYMVEELKPFIDRNYRTRPDRQHTAVAGASLGGLISFYMAWKHPDIYFAAACFSPAFDYKGERSVFDLVKATRKTPDLRLLLYGGVADDLEQELITGMREMAKLLHRRKQFKDPDNLMVIEDTGGAHNEATWAQHMEECLRFLFGA
jgi:predicted alpha/beta superfamily hydrolase